MILLHELRRELSIVLSMVGQSFPVASFHATIIDGAPVILIFHNGRALFTFFLIFYFLPFQRPSAASARQRARRAGSLVTASSSRMSRPSRLTGARTWRWVHCPPLRLIVKTLPNSTGSADRLPSFPPLLREFFGNFCRLQFFFFVKIENLMKTNYSRACFLYRYTF